MGYISEEKLYAPFNKTKTLEIDYVQKAKKIAERINKGEEVPAEELAEIRNAAIADRTNLKGDFVISCFLDALQQFNRWDKGKMIRTNDREVEKVYRNYFSKEITVVEFCKRNPITRSKYYRIVNCDVQNVDALRIVVCDRWRMEIVDKSSWLDNTSAARLCNGLLYVM